VLVGVKVTPCAAVPAFSKVVGAVNAKLPGTAAVPPVNAAAARVWP
jgi:hypothetical protein